MVKVAERERDAVATGRGADGVARGVLRRVPEEIGDLVVIASAGAVLLVLALAARWLPLGPLSVVRAVLGMAFVLLAPGYTLQAALYPRRRDLDGAARVAMSFGLSISLTAPLAVVLDRAGAGVGLLPMSLGLVSIMLACGGVAAWRRGRVLGGEGGPPSVDIGFPDWWDGLDTTQRRLLKLGGAALAIALFAAVAVPFVPRQGERMTEFYMLGSEGLAQDFPREATLGQPFEVTVGIVNREGAGAEYRIEAVNGEVAPEDAAPVRLESGAKSERTIRIVPGETAERVRVGIVLFRDGDAEPYRSLRLWLKVTEGR